MYVQNLTIGLEHIKQKRWAIPHCVLESYFILQAGCDEINQVQVFLFDTYPLCESEDKQPQLCMLWVMLNINPFVPTTRIPLSLQSRWHLTDYLKTPGDTLTPATSSHTIQQLWLLLFSQISQCFDSGYSPCHSAAYIHLRSHLNPNTFNQETDHPHPRTLKRMLVSFHKSITSTPPHSFFVAVFSACQKRCFEVHHHKQELKSSSLSLLSLSDCL